MNKNLTLALLATGLVGVAALAQAGDDTRQERREERREKAEAAFNAADSNHDGALSQSEWQAKRLRDSNEMFAKLDLNRDGSLTREELQQSRRERMERRHGERGHGKGERLRALDTDGDQQLSRAELGDRMPRLAENFDTIDANRDGKLSRDEMRAARQAHAGAKLKQ